MSPAADAPSAKVARRIRVRALLFLVLALAAGGGAVFLVKKYLDQAQNLASSSSVAMQPLVVAAIDIPIATKLTEQHVTVTRWPAQHVPAGGFVSLQDVLGRTTRQRVVKGEPVLAERLADQARGQGLAAILDKGKRAMAVKVDQVVGVAGFVQPGDFVDVITTMTPDEETRRELRLKASAISKVILQNIKVLTVGEHMATQGSKPVKVQVVTLEVTPEQSERIALASRRGAIQLTMRSRIDQEPTPTEGATQVTLLMPDEGGALAGRVPDTEAQKGDPRLAALQKRVQALKRRVRRGRGQGHSTEKKPDEAPVVEVLRGGRVEQRKLRPSADSKGSGG